ARSSMDLRPCLRQRENICMQNRIRPSIALRAVAAAVVIAALIAAPAEGQALPNGKLAPKLAKRAEAALKELNRQESTIAGVAREALLHIPADAAKTPAPVVFAFHGH